jgi:hypothetical protein
MEMQSSIRVSQIIGDANDNLISNSNIYHRQWDFSIDGDDFAFETV